MSEHLGDERNANFIAPIKGNKEGQPVTFVRNSTDREDANGFLTTTLDLRTPPQIGRIISDRHGEWQIVEAKVITQGNRGDVSAYEVKLAPYKE
ncbi:MAG TPA: hypothetical protein VE973_01990 [Candidatus Limnocylindria bacterium]|nr:hypothetical protein [Candidatus Limnocylindria bacterium]